MIDSGSNDIFYKLVKSQLRTQYDPKIGIVSKCMECL